MRKDVSLIAPLALLVPLAVAGCNSGPTATSAASTGTAAALSTTANGPLRAPGGSNLAAEDICVKAVQQQTNAVGVGVIGSEVQAPNTLVMISYPKSRAPWRCVVAAAGNVSEVTYTGS